MISTLVIFNDTSYQYQFTNEYVFVTMKIKYFLGKVYLELRMPECPCPWKSAPESLPLFTFPLLSCYIFSFRGWCFFVYIHLFLGNGTCGVDVFYIILHIICRNRSFGNIASDNYICSRNKYILVLCISVFFLRTMCDSIFFLLFRHS